MEVLKEIVDWASGLPLWQQVAVVKILNNGVDEDTVGQLVGYCKLEQEDKDELVKLLGDPLKNFKLQAGKSKSENVKILEINSTKNINAIKDDSIINFNETGLTIVFGSNAVGKSGYSRIFKAACTCRDTEEVHGNISREEVVDPEASIVYSNSNSPITYNWSKSAESDALLKTVHIFDARTSRIQLSEKNDVKYVPAGLDIFDKLADLFEQVNYEINQEILQRRSASPNIELIFSDFADTDIYAKVSDLSDEDNAKAIIQIAVLSEQEIKNILKLEKEIKIKDANDPIKLSQTIQLKRNRFIRFHNHLNSYQKYIDQDAIQVLWKFKNSAIEATKIAETAKSKKFDKDNIEGTGGDLWKILWDSAKEFSNQKAFHQHEFPYTGTDSVCVLCQQPISRPAKKRFVEFTEFVNDKSQLLSSKANKAYNEAYEEVDFQPQISKEEIEAVLQELKDDEYPEFDELNALYKSCVKEHARLLSEIADFKKTDLPKVLMLDFAPRTNFKKLLEEMAKDIEPNDSTKHAEALSKLREQLKQYKVRQLLDKQRNDIKKEIINLKNIKMLTVCSGQADTTNISRKGGDLSTKYLSKQLSDNYNTELQALNRKGLIVELVKSHVSKGVTYSAIVIKSGEKAQQGSFKPDEILSESEQKIASIAGFFTELSLSPHKSAIIFDDPVTSLDELNTARIAERIVEESKARQVIVFTHNLFFTSELMETAKEMKAEWTPRTVSKRLNTGNVTDELPWQALSTEKRIGTLKVRAQNVRKEFNNDLVEEYDHNTRFLYTSLRETWERAVEEKLFNDVVKRYSRNISTQQLGKVIITDDDKKIVFENMKHCSNYAHDQPKSVSTAELPEPDQIDQDITTLEDWVKAIKQRQK